MTNLINKVLVVDDDPAIREGVADLLTDLGYQVRQAPDGKAACHILIEDKEIALILTDLRMPKLDGVGLLAWCRAQSLHMPVVLMSAERHLLPREKLALCDCCAFLLYKPFDVDTLVEFLRAAEKLNHELCATQEHGVDGPGFDPSGRLAP